MNVYFYTLCIITLALCYSAEGAGFKQSLADAETCMAAKISYWDTYPDVKNANLDPVWHYKNSPPSEGRVWAMGLCNETSIFPDDDICGCSAAIKTFIDTYKWIPVSESEAFPYWISHQRFEDGGIVWHGEYCYNETNEHYNLPYSCTCLAAVWDYRSRYTDVAEANIDPILQYENSGKREDRFWDCSLCDKNPIFPNDTRCNCTTAARNFTNMYPWHKGLTLGNAFGEWLKTREETQEYWPCDLCMAQDASMRDYSVGLAGGLGAIVGLGILLGLFAAVILGVYWSAFVAHGSFYSSVIIFGVMLGYVSALMLLPEPSDLLCVAFPWVLGVAFVLVYGCLFIKTWVLYRVWRKALNYKRSSITPSYIIKALGVSLAVEIIFLIIWTAFDPPKVHLVKMVDGTYQHQCKSENTIFWALFISLKGVWLLFGVTLSILTRSVVKEYNESNSIAYAIYNDIGLAIVAIPLSFVLSTVPGGALVVEVAAIVLSFSFTLCILFFNVWYSIFFPAKDVLGERLKSMSQRASASTASTASTASAVSTTSSSPAFSLSASARSSVGVVVGV